MIGMICEKKHIPFQGQLSLPVPAKGQRYCHAQLCLRRTIQAYNISSSFFSFLPLSSLFHPMFPVPVSMHISIH